MKVVSINGRTIVVDVEWDDGLSKKGLAVPESPVESFNACYTHLTNYVSGVYAQLRAEADAIAHANPTPDPLCLAAIGKTFDNDGNVVA